MKVQLLYLFLSKVMVKRLTDFYFYFFYISVDGILPWPQYIFVKDNT